MKRVGAWFRAHPVITTFLVIVMAGVGGLLFANWRSETRWQKYRAEAPMRGIALTGQEWVPQQVPSEQNFAELPMIRRAVLNRGKLLFTLPRPNGIEPPFHGVYERDDLAKWAAFFKTAGLIKETTDTPWRDVLQGLDSYAPKIQEWGQWRQRPYSQFPARGNGLGMIEESLVQSDDVQAIFVLRMTAHLAGNDAAAALADFEDALQCYWLRINPQGMTTDVLATGTLAFLCSELGLSLSDEGWNDAALRHMESNLGRINHAEVFKRALAAQRVSATAYGEFLATHRNKRFILFLYGTRQWNSWLAGALGQAIPSCVVRDNELQTNEYFDRLLAHLAVSGNRFKPLPGQSLKAEGFDMFPKGDYFGLFNLYAGPAEIVFNAHINLQLRIDQTRLAIALERFRRAHGGFPEELEELVPKYIDAVPLDSHAESPMIYRRTEPGSYLLYGVGEDGKDDGGTDFQKDRVWMGSPKGARSKAQGGKGNL